MTTIPSPEQAAPPRAPGRLCPTFTLGPCRALFLHVAFSLPFVFAVQPVLIRPTPRRERYVSVYDQKQVAGTPRQASFPKTATGGVACLVQALRRFFFLLTIFCAAASPLLRTKRWTCFLNQPTLAFVAPPLGSSFAQGLNCCGTLSPPRRRGTEELPESRRRTDT